MKETPKKLAEILNIRSFEVENIEKIGHDFALDAKIPANRISDALHHRGLAKEIAAITNHKLQIENPKSPTKENIANLKSSVRINIAASQLCSRYTAQELEIKDIGPSPKRMQERLITCGMRPVDAVVDITNYVMLEIGTPLHAFDSDKIRGGKVTIRESKSGEEVTTLDNTSHTLSQGLIVIEDSERIIDLAGIMGGANSSVSSGTKRILLQAATFDPVRIYKATRMLNFSSAASKIYSAGIDPSQTKAGLERAIELFISILHAQLIGPVIDMYPKKVAPIRVLFRPDYASRAIGQDITPAFYRETFERLGFNVSKKGSDFIVEIPTMRRDIVIEEDLIEEAARMFGYEKISPKLPELAIAPPSSNDEYFWEEQIRDYLAGAGFTESILYEFTGERELQQFSVNPEEAPRLENPMNPETARLVPRVLIKYISSVAENLRNFDSVRIFGIAKSFRKKEGNVTERKDLILALSQKGTSGEEEFYRLKGALDILFESLRISDYWYDDKIDNQLHLSDYQLFHPYRLAEIKIGDEKIGIVGEIHPSVLKNIKAKARITSAEIDFERLWQYARTEAEYRPLGKYPSIIRDIALIAPVFTKTEDVLNVIELTGGALLVDSDLFDYFQDATMREAETKSLAFHLIFQSPDCTLTDREIDSLMARITQALEAEGWEVRK